MHLHQILTGSCNIKDQCISYGSVSSLTFIAYGSGSDVVILNHDFVRHQIIHDDIDFKSQIIAISCSKFSGQILVLYNTFVCVYDPQHIAASNLNQGLNKFVWIKNSQFSNNGDVFNDLCWVPKVADTLVLVGNTIQIWTKKKSVPTFSIGVESEGEIIWDCLYKRNCSENNSIERIKFSPDGKFFATCGLKTKELFIWFWDQNSSILSNKIEYFTSIELFDFVSLKHPTNILSFEWRNISHFLPRNSINNVILTCCDDNVCRIWSESHLHHHIKPNSNQNESNYPDNGISNEIKFSDHLKNIFFKFIQKTDSQSENFSIDYLNYDLKNIKTYDTNGSCIYPKFVLSAAINDTSDIPLFSSISSGNNPDTKHLIIHWLDNKELDLTSRTEYNLRHFTSGVVSSKESKESLNKDMDNSLTDKLSQFKRKVIFSIEKWRKSTDVVFAIHPQNGSLLIWLIHNLDDSGGHSINNIVINVNKSIYIKNAQISVHSCLPNCVPVADAISMCSDTFLYCDQIHNKSFLQDICSNEESSLVNKSIVNYDIRMISKQKNGSLNMWNLTVSSEETGNSSILNMQHLSRISGHRWQTNSAACHIQLPLLLTISNLEEVKRNDDSEVSELILWRTKQVGQFSKSGGITEIARINSVQYLKFMNIAWFPGTIASHFIGLGISSPSSFFIATDSKNVLYIYLSIINAKDFIKNAVYVKFDNLIEKKNQFQLVSLASSGDPGCILSAGTLNMTSTDLLNNDSKKIQTIFLHVYTKDAIIGNFKTYEFSLNNDNINFDKELKYNEIYYVVRITLHEKNGLQEVYIEMWCINIFNSNKEQGIKTFEDLIRLNINNDKVYNEKFELPHNVRIIKAVPAFGHLSSASIYPECLAPYMITITCTDNVVRFLKCVSYEIDLEISYKWHEWTMELTDQCSSSISLKENCVPLNISCAYSGRVAIAYSLCKQKFLKDINIDIYECESTGGSEWILEDSIKLTDISIQIPNKGFHEKTVDDLKINEKRIKDFLLIDWVNSEDGSHLLSVSVGTQIFIFSTTCSEISTYESSSRFKFARWMKVKEIHLKGSDASITLPDHISWAREGLLIVGLNNELHVYNQWNDKMNEFLEFSELVERKYDFVDNDRDLTKVMKIGLNENFSIARLKDAYYSKNDFKRSYSRTYIDNIEIEAEPNLSSDDFLQNSALFEAAQIHNPVLPQYHPKQLMAWINFGKINRVTAILSHLTNCTSDILLDTNFPSQHSDLKTKNIDNLLKKSQLEIKAIPPLSLYVLLEIDALNKNKLGNIEVDDVFNGNYEENTIMDFTISTEDDENINDSKKDFSSTSEHKQKSWTEISPSFSQLLNFGPKQAKQLSKCLTHIQIPGLSTLDQAYLIGIAELMSNIKNAYPVSTDRENITNTHQQYDSNNSMDDCGLRFLLAMQHFSYMIQTLPHSQRTCLLDHGIDTSSLVWGFHSETEDELCVRLDEITSYEITWDDFKRYGCGWWIRNDLTLQRVIEKISKNIFQKTKDPMDTAIFYLAMGKQKLLSKLFRNASKDGLGSFFMLDFSLSENRTRALSQAFKMRSKRRYDHAVALFLLCKSIDDALLICLHNLKDIQMALTISRLYDLNVTRNSKNLESIIINYVLQNEDPFLRSMGYWMIKEYTKSLDTLLSSTKISETNLKSTYNSSDPAVFVFYNFLKKQPIILKQNNVLNKVIGDEDLKFKKDDCITPKERRLFFRTAYTYLKMGCPDLALEVLSKLPEEISTVKANSIDNSKIIQVVTESRDEVLDTGLINWDDFMDSTDTYKTDFQMSIDSEKNDNQFSDFENNESLKNDNFKTSNKLDIMCLQYKFMICLKLISEELCTLATGIETNGSFLRYNFYTWLEKEVQVIHHMCQHITNRLSKDLKLNDLINPNDNILCGNNKIDTLEQNDIEKKKLWLKTNYTLLLSLHSFCSLRGPSIVGLSSIRMELLILIQELQGSCLTENDLCKSLPSCVNLPFINSALSCDNGLVITPIQHLKALVTDIIDCINSFQCPFAFLFQHSDTCTKQFDGEMLNNRNKIKVLRSQCQALSACLHQCLSNFDNHSINSLKGTNRIRHSSTNVIYSPESDIHLQSKKLSESLVETISPNTDPRNWPGFSNLIHIISTNATKDIFNFSYLLGESLIVVYVGILVYALHLNDANLLYRLTNVEFNKVFWGKVFGGTLRKKPMRPTDPPASSPLKESPKIIRNEMKSNISNFSGTHCNSRNRLYANLVPPIKQQSSTVDEKFIAPFHSILTALLEKPVINRENDFIYDSDDKNSIDEDDDDSSASDFVPSNDSECQNSKSYTWSLLRLVILHSAKTQITELVKLLQIENGELPIFCPNIFQIIKCLNRWETQCKVNLLNFPNVPRSYCDLLNDCDIKDSGEKSSRSEVISSRINKICKQLTKENHIPFPCHSSMALSMKRLWINLIGDNKLQPLFIQQLLYLNDRNNEINSSQKSDSTSKITNNNYQCENNMRTIKIIHKEHDCIYSLAVNEVDKSVIATCTSKEIIELNINNLNNPEKWMKDDFDYILDIVKDTATKDSKPMNRSNEYAFSNDFLLVTPTFGSHINYISNNYSEMSNVTLKRPVCGVQILKSHPSLPYYLTGNNNGQVSVYEWAIDAPIVKSYFPIQKGKITSLNFDESGNKFGMGDSEGNFSLCHFSYADNSRAQYFNTRCPHKGVMDFCFLNSSSVIATCGGSSLISTVNHLHAVSSGISTFDSNSVNISIWDILLPPGRNQVRSFSDPQLAVGVVTLCYSSRFEVLIIGTRKGEIAIIDLKQSAILNIYQAHDSSITSIKLDPLQFYFVSSAADGFIKIWNIYTQELLESFRSDPVKPSVFRQADTAIKSLDIIDDDKLLTCGADGFIRLRYLDPKALNNNINFDAKAF